MALQNIIYFATYHGEKVRLYDAAPRLLELYEHHAQEQYRTMALAALHAIGDARTMKQLAAARKREPSERLRRLTLAALADYYKEE